MEKAGRRLGAGKKHGQKPLGASGLRVLLEIGSMSDAPEEEGAEGDVDHGLGDVEALFIVSHEASPAHHPTEGSLDNPTARQDVEACGAFDPADHLDDEVEEGGLVHQCCAIIGAVGKEMFDPGPALTDRVEDGLAAGRVRDVRRRQIDEKQPAIGIYGNVTFVADDLLGRVEAALLGRRGLDGLAVDHGGRGARRAPRTLAVHHQREVVDRVEQQAPNEAAKPPVHRLPGREIAGQHLPAAARTNQITDCVNHFPQVGLSRSKAACHSSYQGLGTDIATIKLKTALARIHQPGGETDLMA